MRSGFQTLLFNFHLRHYKKAALAGKAFQKEWDYGKFENRKLRQGRGLVHYSARLFGSPLKL